MSEELQLRVESKLLEMSLDDLKDVAVKLRIEDPLGGLSKMAVIRAIRAKVEMNLGHDEGANVEYLEALIKALATNPLPLDCLRRKGDCENETNEELEKRKALAHEARKEYEAVEKHLKEKEALLKEAQDSLQKISIGIPEVKPLGTTNVYEGKAEPLEEFKNNCWLKI